MALAQIGPLSTVLEAVATAVGSGIVVASAITGIVRLASGRTRREIEDAAAVGGVIGGGFGGVIAALDLVLRYAGLK